MPLVLEMGVAIKSLLKAYFDKHPGEHQWFDDGRNFFQELQQEALQNPDELIGRASQGQVDVPVAPQRMWTSEKTFKGK